VQAQGIRSVAEGGQVVRATTKPGAEEVASDSEGETGNRRASSSAEGEAVGENEVVGEGERAKGEGVAAAG